MVDLSYIGEIRKNTNGTKMQIIAARKKSDIDIQFLDEYGYIAEHQVYQNFKTGQLKNPYDRTVFGVGYIGVGNYRTGTKHRTPIQYVWHGMIERCYSEKLSYMHPAYYGKVTVCEEWHNFQTFGKWYDNNFYDIGEGRMHMDKDILEPGNTIYSPDTCIFVPQRINELFTIRNRKVDGLPQGITITNAGKYHALYGGLNLGTYNTLEEAFVKYAEEKENTIKEVAEEYKSRIPLKLYDAMMKYKVTYEIHNKAA